MITNNNKRPSAITQRKNYTSKQIKTMTSHLIEDEKTDVDSDTEIE